MTVKRMFMSFFTGFKTACYKCRMSILLTILALSTSGADASQVVADKKAAVPTVQCRDESGRFRLGCFPKGAVKAMPGRSTHESHGSAQKGAHRRLIRRRRHPGP